jgi:hypothetical protein
MLGNPVGVQSGTKDTVHGVVKREEQPPLYASYSAPAWQLNVAAAIEGKPA